MARDYARNRSSRRNARVGKITPRGGRRPSTQGGFSRKNGPSKLSPILWLISGIALGLLIASIFLAKQSRHPLETTKPAKSSTQSSSSSHTLNTNNETDDSDHIQNSQTAKHTASRRQTTKKHSEAPEPHYDFYTMLPKNKIEASTPAANTTTETPSTTPAQYHLQIATMSRFQEADQLKAELILLGYNASISKHKKDGSTRYRVNVGPFSDLKAATAQQESLLKDHFKSLLLPE